MLILKIVQTATVIITQTNHTTYLAKVCYFNLKQNPSVQVHYKDPAYYTPCFYCTAEMLAKQRMT